ncbi:MAG: hypothetical protein J5648_04930 [Lachnospiraceae bacterium]|nr:hypothetical protein [Lachnospiraceae bacterium]MBR5667517.1 hypothetical protein [Lachnospiraceae bacterium]
MFKSLNQNEMLKVNGGVKYIPVYSLTYYIVHKGGKIISTYYGPKTYLRLECVASSDPRTEIVKRYTKDLYV